MRSSTDLSGNSLEGKRIRIVKRIVKIPVIVTFSVVDAIEYGSLRQLA
jgi:hypothetical protein